VGNGTRTLSIAGRANHYTLWQLCQTLIANWTYKPDIIILSHMVLFLDQWRSLITNVMAVHERYFIVFFIHHFGQLASFIHSFIYIYCTHRMCFFLLNFKWKLINLTFYSSVKEFRQHKIILFLYSSDLSHTLQHRHNFGIWSIL